MKFFIEQFIDWQGLSDKVIIVPSKQEAVLGVPFFEWAEKIDVLEERFLAYWVSIAQKKILFIEAGCGSLSLLLKLNELVQKGVKKFFFINRAVTYKKKIKNGAAFLVQKSRLLSLNKAVSLNLKKTDFKDNKLIHMGNNLSLNENHIFLKKKINDELKIEKNIDCISIGDYDFIRFLKEKKAEGLCINYICKNLFVNDQTDDEDTGFTNAMTFLIDYLV